MKKLIIMRGLPASGKSTWIKDKGYELFSLSMDQIRLMFKEPSPTITQEYNRRVYEIFYEILEKRMENGSFTVIDNVNLTMKTVKPYLELADKYDYEFEIIDFTDISMDECLERNSKREGYKFVNEDAIKRMHKQAMDSEINFKNLNGNRKIQ